MASSVNEAPPPAGGGMMARLRELIPSGRALPDDLWLQRHRVISVVLWLHVVGLFALGLIRGQTLLHTVLEVGLVVAAAVLANVGQNRRWRASVASFGLISASAVLVHFAGGVIEFHFHFFVMLAVIVLYHDWIPFLLSIGYVALHHGVVGVLYPSAVFSHQDAINNPWLWATVHAVFVLGACAAHIASWQLADHHAVHDTVTGLPNREFFRGSVDQALARGRLHGSAVGVVHLDVHNLRDLSAQWGRTGTEELMRLIAERLRESVSPSDTVARLGWSEFGVATEEVNSADDLNNLSARMRYVFKRPLTIQGREVIAEVIVGTAYASSGGESSDSLMHRAEMSIRSTAAAA